MGFIKAMDYQKGMSAWRGEWLSMKGLLTNKKTLLEEMAAAKNVSVTLLKKAIPEKFIGSNDILGIKIDNNSVFVDKGGVIIGGQPFFFEKASYSIRKNAGRYEIIDSNGNVLFFYYSYQSQYHDEDDFEMYSYVIKDSEGRERFFISLTDIDNKTENTDGTSIHAFISDSKDGLCNNSNMCTFVLCDGMEDNVFRGLFGVKKGE